jgi:hypothetical protein
MYYNSNERFNTRQYYRKTGIPRSTINDMRDRLEIKGLIDNSQIGNPKLTLQGEAYVEMVSGGAETPRRGRREAPGSLSVHYLKYKAKIKEKPIISENFIKRLNPIRWKPNRLMNWTQYFVYFDNATIIINPKQIIVRVHDLIVEDTEEAHYKGFEIALLYFDKLFNMGLIVDNVELEPAHYARIDSILADTLSKLDNKYYIELPNGHKFWIDTSLGRLKEDETDDGDYRERLDEVMKSIKDSNSDFYDLDKLIEITGNLTKVSANLTFVQTTQITQGLPDPTLNRGRIDYIG